MTDPAEVIVINPGYWADKAPQLAQVLRTTPSGRIGDPTGKPPDPETMFTVVDPGYWASRPHELRDTLSTAAGGALVQGRGGGQAAGAASTPHERLTLTVEEAAQVLGISRAFAYESVRRGDIPHIKIGRRILVSRAALDRLLEGADQQDSTS
jgi:excisionase family DNA binding protein